MKPPARHAATKAAPGKQDARLEQARPGRAEPEHARLDLEHFLPYRLSVLSNRISQTIAGAYARRFGIGVTEWRVVPGLGRYPGLPAHSARPAPPVDKGAVQ